MFPPSTSLLCLVLEPKFTAEDQVLSLTWTQEHTVGRNLFWMSLSESLAAWRTARLSSFSCTFRPSKTRQNKSQRDAKASHVAEAMKPTGNVTPSMSQTLVNSERNIPCGKTLGQYQAFWLCTEAALHTAPLLQPWLPIQRARLLSHLLSPLLSGLPPPLGPGSQ